MFKGKIYIDLFRYVTLASLCVFMHLYVWLYLGNVSYLIKV